MQNRLYRKAYAKINLLLDVGKLRCDGFHDIHTIYQKIDLYDEIFIEKIDGDFFIAELEDIPTCERLEYKACKYFFETIKKEMTGIKIETKKYIPNRAGLGGGSSDAAKVLLLLNQMFDYPLDEKQLLSIAEKIGSDVPFFIYDNPCMYGEGRGEILFEKQNLNEKYVLIVLSGDEKESTGKAYAKLDLKKKIYKSENQVHNKDMDYSSDMLYNDFELIYDDDSNVRKVLELLKNNNAKTAHLCGAGTSCFGIFETKNEFEKAFNEISKNKYVCIKTKFLD